jgi:hypothetical protein
MDDQIAAWEHTGDRRRVFLRCYRVMTGNMLDAIEEGYFRDSKWINTLLHRFADYYFRALHCYDCGDPVTRVWKDAHQRTQGEDLHNLQRLLLGINAHINYDLVLTLRDMLHTEWDSLSTEQREARYLDHCLVNQVIGASIDQVQDEILEPGDPVLAIMDRLLGRVDEYLVSRLIRKWRQEVWEQAEHFLTCSGRADQERLRANLEKSVLDRGERIVRVW